MPHISAQNPIAYFCAEYGLKASLPFYAGGLGVLAGDTLKAAADLQLPMVAVGLLYRGDRAVQKIDANGLQIEQDLPFDPLSEGMEHVYLDDQPLFIKVHLAEVDIWCRVWKETISDTVTLYLLDTDTDQNQLTERSITHPLYSGTAETSLKQQLILGIGGVKLLHFLGIHPAIIHLNEGRPAFLHWQLIRWCMAQHGCSYQQATQLAKARTVYTNHTLVAAGNHGISLALLSRYAKHYAQEIGVSLEQLLEFGLIDQESPQFLMTRFALNTARKASGVSQLHTQLAQQRWPAYNWVNVTNGVHLPTWQDSAVKNCDLADNKLWQVHQQNKQDLVKFVKQRTGYSYNPEHLVITWARRLAGYKRLGALFADVARLRAILHHEHRPVQLLVAGKAHVLDKQGKIKLQQIIKYMAKELAGQALFVPNYDLEVAKFLVKGSDLWINIPEQGKEACGTSGMKAISNGVLQCTVADGWAHEVDWQDKGWVLDSNNVSNHLYETLEQQIVPMFYERDQQNIPQQWLARMKASVSLAGQFSARRMVQQYQERLYS
ncbi:MAG: alpha-glucan family phosphorylase [Candidatus Pacebacteria bacterium]|nr:alpha-glucan family phosphorylase [Candidatus Paceibacterota bacterium]